MAANLSTLLAHQGGWDEILFVVAPMAVFGGLLWMANKRADKQLKAKGAGKSATPTGQDERVSSD